jgi:hypothetical protein
MEKYINLKRSESVLDKPFLRLLGKTAKLPHHKVLKKGDRTKAIKVVFNALNSRNRGRILYFMQAKKNQQCSQRYHTY